MKLNKFTPFYGQTMLVANLHALASSIALMTWTKPWLLFEPILVFLELAQFSWTSPFSASLKRLALSLVIGPLENDKGSWANSAPFPLLWSACPAPWCASLSLVIVFVLYFQKLVFGNIKKKQFSCISEIKNLFG